ncbi:MULTISPECIES: VOC family protein [unclassified Rathayibacter]|uniref:SMU1112c/YaeR family gloxylase I-like metalloprotein n=1 Tax=unclassified Rathayibacter TaxID=2609250 RepID=UPI001FB34540|nr:MULTISPECIES: VOC family protein [unclassified Rathayibacter]MCJ1673978.1 VOC family protein [Rathayibacter sp. VKM Ac-2929]MCJ1683026.1 VOC family protein [Rathayibacter sp. VKM Ac-2928]
MSALLGLHHVAIIVSDYERAKRFYLDVLGFRLDSEVLREERGSWMANLSLNGEYLLELFTFPSSPERVSDPEALGLRHLALAAADPAAVRSDFVRRGVVCEPLRTDPHTERAMFFLRDPDGLPVEIHGV